MRRALRSPALLALAALAASGGARAADDDENGVPIHVYTTMTTSVGQGTFLLGPSANPYVLSDLVVGTRFSFAGVVASIEQEVFLEWTQSDTATRHQQPILLDTSFSLGTDALAYEPFGLSSTIAVDGTLPVSLASRWSGVIGSLGASFSGTWTVPFIALDTSVRAGARANGIVPALAAAPPTFDPLVTPPGVSAPTCLLRDPTERAAYACGGRPALATSSTSLSLSRGFLDGAITPYGSLALFGELSSYFGPDDAYTAERARTGAYVQHYSQGTLGVDVAPVSWITLSLGTTSLQTLETADGKGVRFPFWDFVAIADNLSGVFVAFTLEI